MSTPGTPVRSVRVDDELWARLDKAAMHGEMTRSDLIRIAVERAIRPIEAIMAAEDERTAN